MEPVTRSGAPKQIFFKFLQLTYVTIVASKGETQVIAETTPTSEQAEPEKVKMKKLCTNSLQYS